MLFLRLYPLDVRVILVFIAHRKCNHVVICILQINNILYIFAACFVIRNYTGKKKECVCEREREKCSRTNWRIIDTVCISNTHICVHLMNIKSVHENCEEMWKSHSNLHAIRTHPFVINCQNSWIFSILIIINFCQNDLLWLLSNLVWTLFPFSNIVH